METVIDRYFDQGKQLDGQHGKKLRRAITPLRQIARAFDAPSKIVRQRITQADSKIRFECSDRILEARSLDEVLH